MRYQVKDGFTVRQVAGTWVAMPTGSRAVETSTLVTLNDTAVFVWNLLVPGLEFQELLEKVTEEYNVDLQTAETEILRIIEFLKNNNLLED